MENEIISWKFVEENYPGFQTSEEIEKVLYLKQTERYDEYCHLLIQIYQKSIVAYMNRIHVQLVQKDLEGFT